MAVLVLAAHPDDEVLGCGGTIRRLADEGQNVHVVILGEGLTSRGRESGDTSAAELERLRATSHEVARLLGARDVVLHGLPDNRFDTLPLLDVVKIVESEIRRVCPTAVYTHNGGDLNVDHRIAFQACLTATRPVPGCPVQELYAFEVASSTEWSFQRLDPVFRPNTFVAIGATLAAKIEALMRYEGEVRPFPHPRSAESLEAIARRWGSVVGVEAAEAFELVRGVR